MDIKKLHPIILIGEGLGEKYKALPIGEKKKVAILSDIEMSNIPASLSHKRNISKNTLRELATELDVCPAFFFIPAQCIQPECLVYKEDEGIVKVNDVRSILNSTVMDQKPIHLIHFSMKRRFILYWINCLRNYSDTIDPA